MKKYLSISVLSILLLSVIIYSCSDNNDDLNTNETSLNEVIFEDLSLKTNVSPNYFDNHFYLIQQLGNNNERDEIVKTVKNNDIDLKTLNTKDVKKFYFNNSEILMFSISIKNSENKIIVYKYDNIYLVNKAEFSSNTDLKQFKLKSVNDQLFYSLELNKENKIGNLQIEKNKKINEFSNSVYESHMAKHSIRKSSTLAKADCCRHAAGWSDCMDCSVSACSSSWACGITFALLPAEMAAGFAVSCIGAGSNTFC